MSQKRGKCHGHESRVGSTLSGEEFKASEKRGKMQSQGERWCRQFSQQTGPQVRHRGKEQGKQVSTVSRSYRLES